MTAVTTVTFSVNGTARSVDVEPRTLLADVLRGQLRLTGTHLGCEHGVCGACTVLLDGSPVRSCLLFAVQADGCEVETVESLAAGGGELNPLQDSFQRHHGLQCGFCTPGILMSLTALMREAGSPDEDEIREYVQGHLCRCTGYQQLIDAAIEESGRRGEEVVR